MGARRSRTVAFIAVLPGGVLPAPRNHRRASSLLSVSLPMACVACQPPVEGLWDMVFTVGDRNACQQDLAWWTGTWTLDQVEQYEEPTYTWSQDGGPSLTLYLEGRSFEGGAIINWDGEDVGGTVERLIEGRFRRPDHAVGVLTVWEECGGACDTERHDYPCTSDLDLEAWLQE